MPGGKINLVRPDGVVISATPEDARLLLGLGYRPEDPDEQLQRVAVEQRERDYSGAGQTALAFGEGVISGLVPGADYLMADDATRARAEYHGTARLLGELGGSLLPIAPATVVGKGLGKVVGGAARTGLKARVAKGVGEGAVFGAQSELSRSALSGDPVSAEQMLAGMGLGAVFGGGAEALAHGMTTMAARAKGGGARTARELAGEMAPTPQASVDEFGQFNAGGRNPYDTGGLDDVVSGTIETGSAPLRHSPRLPSVMVADNVVAAQDAAAASVILPSTWTRLRTTVKEAHTLVDNLSNEVAIAHDEAIQAYKSFEAARPAKFKAYADEVLGQAALAKPKPKAPKPTKPGWSPGAVDDSARLAEMLGQGETKAAAEVADPNIASMAVDARKKHKAAIKAAKGDGKAALEAREAYEQSIKDLADASGYPAFVEMAKPAAARAKEIHTLAFATRTLMEAMPSTPAPYMVFRKSTAEEFEAAFAQVMASKLPEAEAVQSAMTKIVDEMAENAGIAHGGSPAEKLRALGEAGQATIRKTVADFKYGGGVVDGPAASVWRDQKVVTPGSKAQKTSGGFDDGIDADVGDVDWGDVPTPEEAVKSSRARTKEHGLGGNVGKVARREAAYFAASTITGGNRQNTLRSMARYGLVALFLGAKGLAAEGAKNAALRVLAHPGAAKAVSAVGPRAFGLYRSATGVDDTRGDMTARFKARSDELRNLSVAGKDQAFAFAQQLSAAGHPEFAFALYTAAARAQEAIVTRLPKDPPGTRWGTEWIWDAPPEQVEVFAQEYCAAFTPLEFLDAVAEDPEGVHPSAVKVLQEAWPAVYDDFRAEAVNTLLTQGTEGMDTERLTVLSVLFDLPFSPLNDPAFIAAQQASYAPENQPMPPKGGGGSSGPPGRPPGEDATAMQRLNARG